VLADVIKTLAVAVTLAFAGWLAHKLLPDSVQDSAWTWLRADASHFRGAWLLLLVATVAWPIYGAFRLGRRFRARRPPPFAQYRTDEIFGLRWRWRWTEGGSVIYARAHCAHSDLELDPEPTGYAGAAQILYHCTQCGQTDVVVPAGSRDRVEREVAVRVEAEARRRGLLDA
jgi:hypothetical protein